jgi:hypothetical protein
MEAIDINLKGTRSDDFLEIVEDENALRIRVNKLSRLSFRGSPLALAIDPSHAARGL